MDHAINGLKQYMNATIEMYNDLRRKDIEKEIVAYVKAINALEKHYYGEAKTEIETVLSNFK